MTIIKFVDPFGIHHFFLNILKRRNFVKFRKVIFYIKLIPFHMMTCTGPIVTCGRVHELNKIFMFLL